MLGKLMAAAAASLTIGTLALPGLASANPSTASGSCQAGVSYEGHDYPQTNANTATISIDGIVVRTVTFSTSTSGNVANPDKTKSHTWRVVWDRVNGTDGDRTQQGEFAACQTAPTTTTSTLPATTTTVPAATTTTAAPPCQEDEPCWDCATMGNQICGTTTTTTVLAVIPDDPFCGDVAGVACVSPPTLPGPLFVPHEIPGCGAGMCPAPGLPATGTKTDVELAIGLSAVAIGWCLLYIRRSRA